MNTLIKSAAYLLLLGTMFTGQVMAAEATEGDEIVRACEEEAQGMNDPMTYIQQCIEERTAAMQEENQGKAEKSE